MNKIKIIIKKKPKQSIPRAAPQSSIAVTEQFQNATRTQPGAQAAISEPTCWATLGQATQNGGWPCWRPRGEAGPLPPCSGEATEASRALCGLMDKGWSSARWWVPRLPWGGGAEPGGDWLLLAVPCPGCVVEATDTWAGACKCLQAGTGEEAGLGLLGVDDLCSFCTAVGDQAGPRERDVCFLKHWV